MKKIFKLKGELILRIILALAVSFFVVVVLINVYPQLFIKSRTEFYDRTEKELIDEINKKNINLETLKQIVVDLNVYAMDLYVVDNNGVVLYGTNNNIKGIDITKLNKINISDYETARLFRGQGIIKIENDKYLFYDYKEYSYNDLGKVNIVAIVSVLIFFILIYGRISYISKMNKSIKVIAGGNFSERVPLKYKNELTELAEDINFMATELEQEDNKKKEFITNISHDLRTPLTTILGYLKTIEEGKYSSTDELNSYLSIINRKSIYLKGLLDDFFDYSKLSSNDVSLNFTNIYVQEILRQIFFEEKDRFLEKNLELKLSLSEKPYYINGDGELLERAINNLISNAYKYSMENTEVEINLKSNEINKMKYVIIEVINIPKQKLTKEEASKIFERLYKIDKSRGVEGSGLGLSITKEIMGLHKGYIKTELRGEALSVSLFVPKIE